MNNSKEVKWEEFQIPGHTITVPIMVLHEKRYLQVAQRLVWFNLEKQDWIIETEIEKEWVHLEKFLTVRFKCVIKDPSGKIMRVARKTKVVDSETDYESCETGAVGRALSLLGYGTAYDKDMDEGDVVDAPQAIIEKKGGVDQRLMHQQFANFDQAFVAAGQAAPTQSQDLENMGKRKAKSGIYEKMTFEDIRLADEANNYKWTRKRYEEVADGKSIDPWAIEYLDYVDMKGTIL